MRKILASLAVVALCAMAGPVAAHGSHGHQEAAAARYFPAEHLPAYNAAVVDQSGRTHRFVDEVLGSGKVIATFVYTSCTTVCPVSSAVMQLAERELDKRGNKDTRLISISIDPENDGPEELAKLAHDFEAGPRWTLISGSPAEIRPLLRSLGVRFDAIDQHDPMFLVGHGNTQTYSRIIGLPETDELLKALDNAPE